MNNKTVTFKRRLINWYNSKVNHITYKKVT